MLVFALLLAACDGDVAGGAVDGAQIFQNICAACHGPGGKPNQMMAERLGVRDLTSPEFRARVSAGLVEAQVRGGSKNKLMPAYEGALNDAQIKAVAAFVASKKFPEHAP
jgi:cytochrome c oxidase cbb3-type subunit 3